MLYVFCARNSSNPLVFNRTCHFYAKISKKNFMIYRKKLKGDAFLVYMVYKIYFKNLDSKKKLTKKKLESLIMRLCRPQCNYSLSEGIQYTAQLAICGKFIDCELWPLTIER